MAFFHMKYFSPMLCFGTDLNIFIPTPNSDEILNHKDSSYFHADVKFPVLYVLHGAFGDYSDWIRLTGIERYAQDYKIALVMASVDNSFYQDMYKGSNYFTYMTEEVPQYVERLFPVSTSRENTFIAGLSMGGYGALHIAFAKPEKYSAAISLSGAIDIVEEIKDTQDFAPFRWESIFKDPNSVKDSDADIFYQIKKLKKENKPLPKVFQSCGTEDFLYKMNKNGFQKMKDLGVDVTYEEMPGIHDWDYWDAGIRRALSWLAKSKLASK